MKTDKTTVIRSDVIAGAFASKASTPRMKLHHEGRLHDFCYCIRAVAESFGVNMNDVSGIVQAHWEEIGLMREDPPSPADVKWDAAVKLAEHLSDHAKKPC